MDEQYIEFNGTATVNDDVVRLEADDGTMQAWKEDVNVEGAQVTIRQGARVRIVRDPAVGGKPTSLSSAAQAQGSQRTKSIGFVMICCESYRVIGSGLGFWNECPEPQDGEISWCGIS